MGEWRRLKIGDVCDIVKGETGLASATPGQYPMVATGAERRSCSTYQFDTEAVCIPLVSSTGHGKKTLNYVHYQSGKFALGTILAAVIPKDPKVLTARYLHLYLSHFKDTVLVPLMKGAANVSLPMKGIASVEIPVPSVGQQQKLIDLIGRIESEHLALLEEGNRQADLFKQLRQAVLREAVEGKLTTDWRKQHPLVKGDPQHDAATLLAQFKAEKERLAKAGKIKKEKPLPPINDGDTPFGLPAGWVWSRLGEIIQISSGDGLTSKEMTEGGTIPVYGGNGINGYHDKANVCEQTIAIGRVGAQCGSVHLTKPEAWVTDNAFITSYNKTLNREWLIFLLVALNLRDKARETAQPVISGRRVYPIGFPLPPLAEQQAIVARVDSLMATIDALEAQVTERKEQAQQLIQAVLRAAFAGGAGALSAVAEAEPVDAPRRTSTTKARRAGLEPAPTHPGPARGQAALPAANQPVPDRILAAMAPGRDYSRAELLVVTGIGEADWIWAIRQLKEERKVVQHGEKRGARYVLSIR